MTSKVLLPLLGPSTFLAFILVYLPTLWQDSADQFTFFKLGGDFDLESRLIVIHCSRERYNHLLI